MATKLLFVQSLLIHIHHDPSIIKDVWVSGILYVWGSALLVALGYIIFAKKPDPDEILESAFGVTVGGALWPIVLVAAVVWLLRALVHGSDNPLISKTARQDRKIKKRDAKIKELEEQLGFNR